MFIKDESKVLLKSEINYLRSKAEKIGINKDIIKVNLGTIDFGETQTWAEQGIGWMTAEREPTLNMTVKSLINNSIKKSTFCNSGFAFNLNKDIIETLTEYFAELAHK